MPSVEAETAKKGLNKKEIASSRHSQLRPGTRPNGFPNGVLCAICTYSDLIRNDESGQVVVLSYVRYGTRKGREVHGMESFSRAPLGK